MVSMEKNEVVEMMTNYVMEINKAQIRSLPEGSVPQGQIDDMLSQMLPQVYQTSLGIYELLVDAEVIPND